MGRALTVNGKELSLLAVLLQVEGLPGLWNPEVAFTEDDLEGLRDSLVEKEVLEMVDGKAAPSVKTVFLLDIAASADSRIEIRTYRSGELKNRFNVYARGEDLMLGEFDPEEGYQMLWVSSLPLAIGGVLTHIGEIEEVEGGGTFACKDAPAIEEGMDEGEISRACEACFSGAAETIIISFVGGEEETAPLCYLRYDNRLYHKQGENFEPIDKVDAVQPVSVWLAYTHRAELLEAGVNEQ